MKKIYTLMSALFVAGTLNVNAQQQPDNGDFEAWENVGSDTEEPTNWNSIMTGDLCGLCALGASQRVFRDDADVNSGSYSARIETTTAFSNIVNGVLTTGKIVVPSTTPSEGHTLTVQADADFSHAFAEMPDSVVFWAKYSVTDNSDSAGVNIVIHDAYDLKDPQDAASAARVIGTATSAFQTAGAWQRISVPFNYSGPSTNPVAYILATFTSSFVPGAGNETAILRVDDMEFIYNPTVTSVVEETLATTLSVYPNPSSDGNITVNMGGYYNGIQVTVANVMGQTVGVQNFAGSDRFSMMLDQPNGMYFLSIRTAEGEMATVRVVKSL